MNTLLIVALCVFPAIFVLRGKTKKVVYIKQLALPVICTAFILCLVVLSDKALKAAASGLKLWLNVVVPSLFPFFVASDLLNTTGFVRAVGILLEPIMKPLFNVPGCGSFPFALGIVSGYPVGAKITASMRAKNMLTKTEAERLIAFTNNSGPLFIIGAVAAGMFKMPSVGLFLLLCHIAACITVGILFRFYGIKSKRNRKLAKVSSGENSASIFKRFKQELFRSPSHDSQNFGTILASAIRDSIMTILSIGGFIILFSVIINLLRETGLIKAASMLLEPLLSPVGISNDIITSVLSGFFEITTGTNLVSTAEATVTQKLCAASLIIGWAGLSVHSQVLSIISTTDLSIKPYLFGKLLQGIISAFYTFIGIKTAGHLFLKAQPVFSHFQTDNWQTSLIISTSCLVLSILLLLTLIIICILGICLGKTSK
ncbi:MAG TPA: sporulation integral membrane protein YlbJ [Clostridiaceae bacterium]|nr:sporulation integral membrane protein YlbJ [Clostridiaceae bacterium]